MSKTNRITTIEGVPTIQIAASLTTQNQVQTMINQLEKMMTLLPEARVRRSKTKAKPATARGSNAGAEKSA